jgi:hypothetical protein
MAAYPLPENSSIPVNIVNALTVVSISVVPGQSIDWQNHTTLPIHITVQPLNGVLPLTVNDFRVPASHTSVGTIENTVLPNTPLGEYPFTRGATEGGGKIIVQGNR